MQRRIVEQAKGVEGSRGERALDDGVGQSSALSVKVAPEAEVHHCMQDLTVVTIEALDPTRSFKIDQCVLEVSLSVSGDASVVERVGMGGAYRERACIACESAFDVAFFVAREPEIAPGVSKPRIERQRPLGARLGLREAAFADENHRPS